MTTDHLGSARVITNENGTVSSRRDYTAFGEESITSDRAEGLGYTGSQDGVRKSYTGYEKDIESGLDFAQARYYNSVHGRFTGVDPLTASASIRNPQTFNRYSYVLNSPYKYVDPLGLAAESPAADAGCNFRCRVNRAINGTAGLSDADKELALFHIRNGSALGYTFLNASEIALGRQSAQSSRSQGPNDSLSLSESGIALLKSYEGAVDGSGEPVLEYYDKDGSKKGNCTVGWGHLVNSGPCGSQTKGKSITRDEADRLFEADLKKHESNVKRKVGSKLAQNEFDALVILDFNFGLGSRTPKLLRALDTLGTDKADFKGIIKEWSDILGAPGLPARRHDELEVFFFAQYGRGKDR